MSPRIFALWGGLAMILVAVAAIITPGFAAGLPPLRYLHARLATELVGRFTKAVGGVRVDRAGAPPLAPQLRAGGHLLQKPGPYGRSVGVRKSGVRP